VSYSTVFISVSPEFTLNLIGVFMVILIPLKFKAILTVGSPARGVSLLGIKRLFGLINATYRTNFIHINSYKDVIIPYMRVVYKQVMVVNVNKNVELLQKYVYYCNYSLSLNKKV